MSDFTRPIAFLTLIVVFLLMVLVRVYVGSASEYRKANEALKMDDKISAINHYGRSIKWYAPLSPWVKHSIEKLWEIGENSDKDDPAGILAIRILRSSLYAARGPFTPYKSQIEKADEWISEHLSKADNGPDKEDVVSVLKSNTGPNRKWSFAVGVGFVGWILSVFVFIFFVFPEGESKVKPKKAVVLGIVVGLFYTLWICGLLLT